MNQVLRFADILDTVDQFMWIEVAKRAEGAPLPVKKAVQQQVWRIARLLRS
ncbi:hypothetical protein BH09ACT8_BH09ACT8_15010 [soil metagenome]